MSQFNINATEIAYVQDALANQVKGVENILNDVLHNTAGPLAQDAIQRLIPVSGKTWAGKKPPAKTSKSLRQIDSNLAVEVKTTKNYQYLYFPNDGTSTKRHAGQQFFFEKGGEAVENTIIDKCVDKIIENFGKGAFK